MRRLISTLIVAVFAATALGIAAGPGPAFARAGATELALVPGTVIVDDLSAGFRRSGSGWRSSPGGYDDHHSWVRASRKLNRVGIWTADLDEPGLYRVFVKVPRWHASSRKAIYKTRTANGWVQRVRNQYRNRGFWLSLGTYAFGTRAEVRLGDKTLDPRGSRRKVAFDAVMFIPLEPPDPPVITTLDVEPKLDRAIATFSLAEAGPAKTEYRKAGTPPWIVGSSETSSKYADHRQVIGDLKSDTDYELRVIATNKGGKTTSPVVRFTTLALDPPVIEDIDVEPADTRAVVTFSLAEKGPARTEYRKDGASTWRDGPNETSYEYKDHRQVIRGLSPGTDYELQVIATNAAGKTTSDLVRFTTTGSRPVTLVTPAAGAQIPQNNPSIGCPLNPTRGHGFQLEFDWTGPSLKGLGAYQLRARHEGARYPAVRSDLYQSEFRWRSCNAFVQDGNLSDWYWQVTVVDNQGRRTDVTEKRPFSFLPCRLADGRPCHAPPR